MDVFSSKGPVGAGAALAAFTVLKALLDHLERSGTLIPKDSNAILENALKGFPSAPNAARDDAKSLIANLKR